LAAGAAVAQVSVHVGASLRLEGMFDVSAEQLDALLARQGHRPGSMSAAAGCDRSRSGADGIETGVSSSPLLGLASP